MFKRFSLFVILSAFALVPVAKADSITFTLLNPVQVGLPGVTYSFVGTIAAPTTNQGNIYLNNDSFNVQGGFLLDDSSFLTNFPFYLTPGQSATNVLFTLSSSASGAGGVSTGTFDLLGGSNASSTDDLGAVTFSAQVTPEPSSLLLMGTGMVSVLGMIRRRSQTAHC